MTLPKALQKQEEEANKRYEDTYASGEEPQAQEEEVEVKAEAEVEVQEDDEEEVQEEQEEEGPVNWQEAAQQYKQQFEIIKGKYDAEIPRLHQELGALKQQIIATGTPSIDDQDESSSPENLFEQMKDDYGEEFITDLRNLIQAEASAGMQPLSQQVQAAQAHAYEFAKEKYFNELSRLVPDWQKIVKDPKFGSYVQQADEFTGHPRAALMQHAEQNLDAHRIAAFYNAFKKANGIKTTGGKKMASVTPGGGPSKQKAAGGREQFVTRAEMNKFAKDVALNKYAGREEEAKKFQAKIDKAIANGWVI